MTARSATIQVVKIGGSLLLRPDLLGNFLSWYGQSNRRSLTLVIIGGGEMINAVRGWDRLRPGAPAKVHWRCVEMLRFSFESMRDAFENQSLGTHFAAIETSTDWNTFANETLKEWTENEPHLSKLFLVNVPAFYHPQANLRAEIPLPEDWRTTTDAIALALAHQVSRSWHTGQAENNVGCTVECTLLKSCDPPPGWTVKQLVEAEIIDPACELFTDAKIRLNVERLPA